MAGQEVIYGVHAEASPEAIARLRASSGEAYVGAPSTGIEYGFLSSLRPAAAEVGSAVGEFARAIPDAIGSAVGGAVGGAVRGAAKGIGLPSLSTILLGLGLVAGLYFIAKD